MLPKLLTPAQSLDLAYRRQKPTREQLDKFEAGRTALLSDVRHAVEQNETEEYVKNLVVRFLTNTNFGGYDVNVRQKRDLVIRTGARPQDPVGVILELKRPQTPGQMVTSTDLNRRAFHELLYYYLQDRDKRTAADSKSLKRLVITNGYEWFLFDALDFDRLFWSNTALKNQFSEFERKAASSKKTSFFYDDIAAPFLAALEAEIPFTHFDLTAPASERDQILLCKLLSPPHLLKEPFAQDANTLNRAFYEELLYLIGLEEIKDKGRKLIQRCAPERQQPGSLLENTRNILDSENELANLTPAEAADYGKTAAERLTGVALELCLTWVNRLLFLKLLEGQLRRYHPGHDARFRFLTPELIPEYDTLNKLFFRVLNTPPADRKEPVKTQYAHIPYLNSSLYEPSLLENKTIKASALEDHLPLPLLRKSVLRTAGPTPDALAYLLRFLDAYDFASEGEEQVQEDGKALISAAVLGLIFEKLNGYKDGSFYTPGFITMYICRQTLRRAVVQHFNKAYGFGVETIAELADALDGKQRPAYSQHFNQLTVCDPAVGSGHFLVSALNELLAIKSELSLLLDDDGRRLRYSLVVARDELVVKDEDERLVQYRATLAPDGSRTVPAEHTRLQSALFREKRHLMEHALFGVDLNPNSVRICRLRLWIELLKHAYYRPDPEHPENNFQQLETLPNLDLNIKPGNSLLSRFPLDADLSDVFKQGKFSLKTYKSAVHEYFGSRGREAKEELQGYLTEIKDQFTATIYRGDPLRREILAHKSEVLRLQLVAAPDMYGKAKMLEEDAWEKATIARMKLQKAEEKLAQRKEGILFKEAFEWRFEFPEILDDQGHFRGFDVVVGNPPYISNTKNEFGKYLREKYLTSQYQLELYVAFIERGTNLLKEGGVLSYITPNSWLKNMMFSECRKFILENLRLNYVVPNMDNVFLEANVDTLIFQADKIAGTEKEAFDIYKFNSEILELSHQVFQNRFYNNERFVFDVEINDISNAIIQKVRKGAQKLETFCDITRGVNSYDKARGQSEETIKARLYHAKYKKDASFVPELKGKHIQPYTYKKEKLEFISYGPWLAAPREKKFFEGKRLVMRQVLGNTLLCTIISESLIIDQSVFIAKLKEEYTDADISLDFILALLSSNIFSYYFKHSANEFDALYPKIKVGEFKELPIPAATPEQQAEIAALVEQVLAAKAADATADTAALEQQIDALVAALYGLTPAEQLLLTA